ncbi:putative pumilio homolog 8, chloroplastic [Ziziphus jujuba]|uniref:Pumilio homolog 8, chloroplastic n=1 Tax=Ziziphus jujuba TaxID=326968 RepID=A0ABM4A7W7_ZIZJJ|nr:putative pumilio homolog 8, chloroplastic [Ziziphus jujuba]
MIDSLSEGFNTLMIDRIGSSIIIKCLKRLDTQLNQKLCEKAVENCLQLATHEKGCIYLNEFITYIRGPYRDQLLETISINSLYLSQDPTGNYVVQHVLGLFNPVFTQKICCILSGHYVRLSSMVGGSHIVEKCLKSPWMDYPLDELVNSNKLGRLAADQFGNYVIQTALKVTKVICSILTISFIYLFFISLSLKLLSFCFFSTACKKSNS